jgi:putative transposase
MGKRRNEWQERAYMLSQFGKREKGAIRAYRKFMEEGVNLGRRPELVGGGLIRSRGGWSKVLSQRAKGEKEEYDSRVLGSGDFVRAIMGEAEQKILAQMKYRREKKSIEEVIGKMCKERGVKVEELRGGGQRRKVSEARGKIAHYLCREMGLSMAEVGRNFGVGISAIAMAIRKEEGGR